RASSVLARLPHPAPPAVVETGKRTRRHIQPRLDGLAGFRRDAGERDQGPQRATCVVAGSVRVNLHDLAPGARAGVAEPRHQVDVVTEFDPRVGRLERFERPLRVAEAVAEGEQRLYALA